MTDEVQRGCITQFTDGPCGKPPTSGLPICGSCLHTLLRESDPRRRRTLAANPGLAAGVVHRLAEDPDDQVRAQVAARNDLDTATTNRLANPDRESAPTVLRSMAATAGGAAHAWELLGTDDPTTLAILAANPAVDPDMLEQLARYPDPDVSWTASATLAGQPAGDSVSARVGEARAFDGLPLSDPATPLSRPGAPVGVDESDSPLPVTAQTAAAASAPPAGASPPPQSADRSVPPTMVGVGAGGSGALPPRPSPDTADGGGGRRRGLGLLVGAAALVVIAAVVLIVSFTGSDSDSRTATAGPDPARTVTTAKSTTPPTTARATTTTSTSPSTTTPPTTVPPTTKPAPTLPPMTPAPVVTPPPPISQNFTIRPASGRFCRTVSVTVNYSPSPAYVAVTDDTGAQVGGWTGPSGQTKAITLPRSTAVLNVIVTAIGSSISVSGSASGDSC